MATGVGSWSQTASSNASADTSINWAEGQAPSSVNDSARAVMARLAEWRDDLAGVKPSNAIMETAGSANAQTLTTNASYDSLTNGWTVTARIGSGLTNTSSVTLNVDSKGAKSVQRFAGTDLRAGDLKEAGVYTFVYYQPADAWLVTQIDRGEYPSGTRAVLQQTAAPPGYTKDTSHNDKALRAVSGTAGSGGTTAFSSVLTSRTIAQANLPSYNLSLGSLTITVNNGTSVNRGSTTKNEGAGNNFNIASTTDTITATLGGTLPSGGSGTAMDFAVQYVDVCFFVKD